MSRYEVSDIVMLLSTGLERPSNRVRLPEAICGKVSY
jgi:hypothetical protein